MSSNDPFDLERFVKAQEPAFDTALQELRLAKSGPIGCGSSSPQLKGLGHSPTAQFYGIASIDEARAYLAHPVLGPRITLCTQVVSAHERQSLAEIFGSPDDLKFVSSMTLFAAAAADEDAPFARALVGWGARDERTLAMLGLSQSEIKPAG